jgi:cation diffusion facilitator family transporter
MDHDHIYLSGREARSERRTAIVIALTAATMVAEIAGGILFGSMALLADGWHMASHVAALSLALIGYRFARRHRGSRRYSFGTFKVSPLAGYTSAILLGVVALLMAGESLHRLARPVEIDFGAAMLVAAIGLVVNLACAFLLGHGEGHHHGGHGHGHDHGHAHHGHDHNLRAAYFHVLADALTSLLALFALGAGMWLGLAWLDPAMGVVGAVIILVWAVGLLRGSARVLLDEEACGATADEVRRRLEQEGERVTDLHLWQIGPSHFALIASVASGAPAHPDAYKARLAGLDRLAHVTIEVVPRGR